jgi:predicted secreted protein
MAGDLVVTESANGTTVSICVGQRVIVHLRGSASTGYQWLVSQLAGVAVEQVGTVEYVPDSPGGIGVGGTFIATFAGAKAGTSTLKMVYVQPWRPDDPAGTFSLTIGVERLGDVNADGCVNVTDLLMVRQNLGATGGSISPPKADVNGDGIVNVADLLTVRNNLGKGCP